MKMITLALVATILSFNLEARTITCNTRSQVLGFPIKIKIDDVRNTFELSRTDRGQLFHQTEASFTNIPDILNCGMYDNCIPDLLGTTDAKITGLASVIQEINAYQTDPEMPAPSRKISLNDVTSIKGFLMSNAQVMGTVGLYELYDSRGKVMASYYHAIELMLCK